VTNLLIIIMNLQIKTRSFTIFKFMQYKDFPPPQKIVHGALAPSL